MIRNFKIIIILVAVSTSFFVIKAIGEGIKVFQNSNLTANADVQSIENNGGFLKPDNKAEIFSENPTETSYGVLSNIPCARELALSAHLALVEFLNNNNMVYEFNPSGHWPIASITKLVTAIVAEENIDSFKTITFNDREILSQNSAEEFKSGETYKADDLIKAMLMISSNDAAEALAQDFEKDKFIGLMNQKAKDLNLSDTTFFDPTGLSAKNQSTPNDIFKIIFYIYQNHREIFKITNQKSAVITELNSKLKKYISNINEFAGQSNFIGGKTGFIDEAQGNLVSVFSVSAFGEKKEPVVIVVLGSQDRFGETKKLLDCVQNPDGAQSE